MKKFTIALLIILLGLIGWAGATYMIGGQVEKHYHESLTRLEKWGPFHLTNENYQRGFLSSRGRTLLEFSVPVPTDEEGEIEPRSLRLTFEHRLRHGPLPMTASTTDGFGLAPQLARIETRLIAATIGNGAEGDLLTKLPWLGEAYALASIGFGGGGRGRLVIPAFEKTIEAEKLTINWGGLRCDTQFSENLATLSGDIDLSGLQLTAKDGRLQWDGAHAEFDLHEAFPMVYLGRSQADSGPFELAFDEPGRGHERLRIEGFAVDSLASQEGDTVEYLQSLKVAKVAVDDNGYGPGEIEISARGLDGKALSQYQQDLLEVYAQESLDPEVIGLQMMQVYLRLLTGLAEGSPEIEFSKLQFATPEGDFSGNLWLKYHGEAGQVPGDVPSLLQKLEGQAQFTADESLVRKVLTGLIAHEMTVSRRNLDLAPLRDEELAVRAGQSVGQQLEALVGQKFIERNEDKLRTKAEFDRGELKVNGRQLM